MGTGQGLGGLRTHFDALLRFAVAEGHQVSALVVADADRAFHSPDGIRCVRMPQSAGSLSGKVRKYAGLRRLEAEVRAFRPELFIAAALGSAYARVARTARRMGAFAIWEEVVSPKRLDALHVAMRNSVDAVAVQTAGLLRPFCEAIPGKSLTGCLPCFFEPPCGDRLAAPPAAHEPVRLAYFGRLAGNKGLVPFLNVFADVTAGDDVRFDIHGDGEERAAIEAEITALNLGATVCMKGRYPEGTEYARLLASYHALVLPSIDCEGLPLVLLEAMSCGLPFLATAIGGIPDVGVGNPDVVIAGPAPAMLREGLVRLLAMLRTGRISTARLKEFYRTRLSQEEAEKQWRQMFAAPREYFAS